MNLDFPQVHRYPQIIEFVPGLYERLPSFFLFPVGNHEDCPIHEHVSLMPVHTALCRKLDRLLRRGRGREQLKCDLSLVEMVITFVDGPHPVMAKQFPELLTV